MFFTLKTCLFIPSLLAKFSLATFEVKIALVLALAFPKLPNIGLYIFGSGVGIEALLSPIIARAINPPFSISSGFTPKNALFHKTKSAIFPTSTLPTYSSIPQAIAGFIVYFAMYLLILSLSLFSSSPSRAPLCFFIESATCQVLITTSPTLPIACESELVIEIAPKSCSTSSAAIVFPLILLSAKLTSSGILGLK